MAKNKHYSLEEILKLEADYNVIYGERSNGKTTAVLRYALENHIESDYVNQLAIVRRWEEDFKGKNGQQMFENIVTLGWVKELTNGKYNSIYYYSQRWFLCYYDEDGEKTLQAEFPFAMGFSLTSEEHYKSTSYPNIKTILFDEFLTRNRYLPDEFVMFQNLLSTIIRLKDDVKIFMCGNTINKYCPYFNEMGLTEIKKQMQGTIDLYYYGESGLKVAVEYCAPMGNGKKKASNKYFAFNNPKLQMITNGGWEIDIYPHLPKKYKPKDVMLIFYVIFDGEILQGNLISIDNHPFIYFHRKTKPIIEDTKRIVYQQKVDYRYNYRLSFNQCTNRAEETIYKLIHLGKVFYQDNEVGEIINNYRKWCEVMRA